MTPEPYSSDPAGRRKRFALEPVRPSTSRLPLQPCPQCGHAIVAIAGSKWAICANCGYKEPCC